MGTRDAHPTNQSGASGTRTSPSFLVFLISHREPDKIAFDGKTLDELVRDQQGLIVPTNVSWFTTKDETSKVLEMIHKVHLCLIDYEYITRYNGSIARKEDLLEYLAAMFCYGSIRQKEEIAGDPPLERASLTPWVAMISEKRAFDKLKVFPEFAYWVYLSSAKKMPSVDTAGTDLKDIKMIIHFGYLNAQFEAQRKQLKNRMQDG